MIPSKLLVVDDSLLLQQMWKLYSNDRNLQVLQALNGREALERLKDNDDVDLIVLDINMPVMNGFDFMDNYLCESNRKKVPIIITSTDGEETQVIRALRRGAKACLKKPFNPEEFDGLVAKIL